jgi:eukaryotic-like serine/threonine-protein kinase
VLLAAGKWQEADQETAKVMLEVANCTKCGSLDLVSIDNFPCEDLRAIDGLWVKYSNGRFGFSVQKRIYESLREMKKYDKKVWEAFGDKVGWRKEGYWQGFEKLTLDIKAPEAHLPTFHFYYYPVMIMIIPFGEIRVFFSRMEACKP